MDYFSKFLRGAPEPTAAPDLAAEFHNAWVSVKDTLLTPDERQLARGIQATNVPDHLKAMTDALVKESTQYEDSTGPCLEYLLKNDVLSTLVRMSETDRPFGIQAEVLRTISNMVVLLDEKFLVHSVIHKAVIRLLQTCMGDEITEHAAGSGKVMGAAGSTARLSPSEYEEDLVNLLCILCSRIRTYPELLMIFFHDKNWAHHQTPLMEDDEELYDSEEEVEEEETPAVAEEAVDAMEEEEDDDGSTDADLSATPTKHTVLLSGMRDRSGAPSPSSAAPSAPSINAPIPHPHYEFLIFNYLMRFIHREGGIGDFGRTGLLFLLDIAMSAQQERAQGRSAAADPVADAAVALADYILEGDFSEVLGAGLGAVYSLLPYKLEVRQEQDEATPNDAGGGMTLGVATVGTIEEERLKAEAEKDRIQSLGADVSTSLEFKARLDHFIKLVEFVQEVLKRVEIGAIAEDASAQDAASTSEAPGGVGRAIAFSILESIRSIFLQNVLYPSILECSEMDGSAVAVMSYINILLHTLQQGRLADVLITFLMADDDPVTVSGRSARPPPSSLADKKKLRRRSSAMVLLSMEAPHSTSGPSEYFTSLGRFTLKDLLISNLRFDGHEGGIAARQTGVAALGLLHTLLVEHCEESLDGLLTVVRDPVTRIPLPPVLEDDDEESDDEDDFLYPGVEPSPRKHTQRRLQLPEILPIPATSLSTQSMEQKMYLNLIRKIDGEDTFSTKYELYLHDAVVSIQSHCCDGSRKHRLLPKDPMIGAVLQSLRGFFAHTPEYNLALTEVVGDIAACPARSLAGWLTLAEKEEDENAWDAPKDPGEEKEDFGFADDRSIDFGVEEKLRSENPTPAFDFRLKDPKAMPVLYTILSGLVAQLDRYRTVVDDFDTLLSERRRGLLFSENLNDALNLVLDVETPLNTPQARGSATPARAATVPPNTPGSTSSPAPKPKSKSGVSFVPSFLTPKKKPAPTDPVTPLKQGAKDLPASPFVPHYQKTTAVDVQAYVAPPPTEGPWSPNNNQRKVVAPASFDGGFDVFSSQPMETVREEEDDDEEPEEKAPKRITLSQLLDNVIVLEEVIKELTAIMQARISLGVDPIRYV